MNKSKLQYLKSVKYICSYIFLFFKQTISEVRTMTIPTRKDIIKYTIIVLIFVISIMLFVTILDVIFGQLVVQLFAN